ncbi:hypothetical protein [Fodinicola feengrottensis]|nr:hypothetical protein [Fodinicola feengrottensis]
MNSYADALATHGTAIAGPPTAAPAHLPSQYNSAGPALSTANGGAAVSAGPAVRAASTAHLSHSDGSAPGQVTTGVNGLPGTSHGTPIGVTTPAGTGLAGSALSGLSGASGTTGAGLTSPGLAGAGSGAAAGLGTGGAAAFPSGAGLANSGPATSGPAPAAPSSATTAGQGGGGMAATGRRATDEHDEEYQTWLTEDEMVWGNDTDAPPPVLGETSR